MSFKNPSRKSESRTILKNANVTDRIILLIQILVQTGKIQLSRYKSFSVFNILLQPRRKEVKYDKENLYQISIELFLWVILKYQIKKKWVIWILMFQIFKNKNHMAHNKKKNTSILIAAKVNQKVGSPYRLLYITLSARSNRYGLGALLLCGGIMVHLLRAKQDFAKNTHTKADNN